MAVAPSCIQIDLSRDSLLQDFSQQTLRERYMLPGETSPQHAFARAAAAFADDEAHAQRLYDYVSKLWFMFATPLLSNGGSTRGLPISCFLTTVEDSRTAISDHYDEVIWLSSMGGGIGTYWGELRSAGETTSKGSKSTGAMPFICVDDRLILAVSQGGTRRGSEAVYLDIHHPEIEEFIVGRKPTGDLNRKFTNLHNAVNLTDEFMRAVRDDTEFWLRSPKTQERVRAVKARDLWRLLIETRMQTGEPYVFFSDTANRHLPEAQKKLGLKITHSNLCVPGETLLMTADGHKPIGPLAGKTVRVWNGKAFSEVEVTQTATDAELIRVWFEDGDFLDCTPEHRFFIKDSAGPIADSFTGPKNVREVRAAELRGGMVLEDASVSLPNIEFSAITYPPAIAYAAGWATVAGFEDNNRLAVHAPSDVADDCLKLLAAASVDAEADEAGMLLRYESATIPSGVVPITWTVDNRRQWLGGVLDAAGDWMNLDGDTYLCVGSPDADLIREMRIMALEAGLTPRIRLTDTLHAFMIDQHCAAKLAAAGWLPRHAPRLPRQFGKIVGNVAWANKLTVVADIHPLPYRALTFCASEPQRGRLTFNGYVTGNCTEITLATGRDQHDKLRTAVCCLSSTNAETYEEWKDHPDFLEDLFRMLDNTLDVFINDAPEGMEKAVYSAYMERSVGLGLLGFHSYLQSKNVAFESEEAERINLEMFRHLRTQADAASLKLGAERGEAPDMAGTGERFAHKLAIAPNASSSIICGGASPSTEVLPANAYLHKTLSGSFPVFNKYLKRRLAELGRDDDATWTSIVEAEGSVQHLDFLTEHDKRVFRTSIEVDQRQVIKLGIARQSSICQAQSINVFFPSGADAGYLSEVHYEAWGEGDGLKSLYYLRSRAPRRGENTNTKVERAVVVGEAPVQDEECFSCQG